MRSTLHNAPSKRALHLLFFAWTLLFFSCSNFGSDGKIICGKWRQIHSNMDEAVGTPAKNESIIMEFRRDGSLIFVENGNIHRYRYQYSGGNLRLILTDGSLDKIVKFDGLNRMRLVQNRQGVAFLTPIIEEYERVGQ